LGRPWVDSGVLVGVAGTPSPPPPSTSWHPLPPPPAPPALPVPRRRDEACGGAGKAVPMAVRGRCAHRWFVTALPSHFPPPHTPHTRHNLQRLPVPFVRRRAAPHAHTQLPFVLCERGPPLVCVQTEQWRPLDPHRGLGRGRGPVSRGARRGAPWTRLTERCLRPLPGKTSACRRSCSAAGRNLPSST
jgi:hypothetical protein